MTQSPLASARARLAALVGSDADAPDLLSRYDRWAQDLVEGLAAVYDPAPTLDRVVDLIAAAHLARRPALRDRDRARVLRPDWFQGPDALGYACYTDRFAGDLAGVAEAVGYLSELGVTYLHLMPLLRPRPAPNDGGYAVADYRSVREDLGDIDDLERLADRLHDAGISLTLDLVLNHVAREHEWTERARAGDPVYRRYFHVFDDRTGPDAYERSLPEVFPTFAPGNFTWDDELSGWVWTTFNEWQWDLDWSNPDVFCEFADIILFLANRGVDVLRLDAIAFIWKRLGTTCQNQPEVHAITQALRALTHIAAPSTVFKAEAIVAPDDLVPYLGRGSHAGKVSDLAYHNSLMVQIWSALATRDARLMARALGRFPVVPTTTAWATYLRCHDDIGWAIDDGDAAAVGWDGPAHREFLADFYAGDFPGSFARGAHFQTNPATGDRRTSGTAASLAGVERARADGDPAALDDALARLRLAHAMVLGFGGVPLLYMGDEIALTNDYSYVDVPEHADDNRWLHRPQLPWDVVARRDDVTTVAGRAFADLRQLVDARRTLPALHASVPADVVAGDDPAIVLFVRRHAAGTVVEVYNVSEHACSLPMGTLAAHGVPAPVDHLTGARITPVGGWVRVPAFAAWWLVDSPHEGVTAGG